MSFLSFLDKMLKKGAHKLGARFLEAQLAYVFGCQQPQGGFAGREGEADLYYTDYGVRLLDMLSFTSWESTVFSSLQRVKQFLHNASAPQDFVDVFCLLNIRRLLAQHNIYMAIDEQACRQTIISRRCYENGYIYSPASPQIAYATFLAALCLELLGEAMPAPHKALAAVEALQQPDGGFAQAPGQPSQTNSTAAAISFMLMQNALCADKYEKAQRYLISQQSLAGGFCAHQGAQPELLSTFTASTTLFILGGLEFVNLSAMAQFVRACAHSSGGFGAYPEDPGTDVEYTYYGVGTLALLQLYCDNRGA